MSRDHWEHIYSQWHIYADEIYKESAREGRYLPIPDRYKNSPVGEYLQKNSSSPEGIYEHQALAAHALDDEHNVVLTTTTGSGKSRVFMAEAFHRIMADEEARVEAFYPLKALGRDQHNSWRKMAKELGLSPDLIGKIDGQTPQLERLDILAKSRIVLLTPDVTHTWMLGNIGNEVVQNHIRNRRLTILDETDSYNGMFGTNMLLMLRRMEDYQAKLDRAHLRDDDHKYIATSATLPDAAAFFKELTGKSAIEISELQNGAPQKERYIAYEACDWSDRNKIVERLVRKFIDSKNKGQGIVFFDSRKDVEAVAARINEYYRRSGANEIAIPQKAGYSAEEQERLEQKLRRGDARVVIATSAWESGIDYDFSFGINVGVPASKKSARQRIGRIGRHQDGLFVFVAQLNAFDLGNGVKDLKGYLENVPVETPKLYPSNEFIQIAQAFCHVNELEKLEKSGVKLYKTFEKTQWPRGFIKATETVLNPGKNLTGEKRILIPPYQYKNKPQQFHALRQVSGSSFLLSATEKGGGPPKMVGSCSLINALEEYPPGAIVRHAGDRKRVARWETVNHQDRIILIPYSGPNRTAHRIKTEGFINLHAGNIIDNEYYQIDVDKFAHPNKDKVVVLPNTAAEQKPFMAVVRGSISRIVSSFVEITPNGEAYPYKYYDDSDLANLQEKFGEHTFDYGPKRMMKMSTTGVLLHVPFLWFGENARTDMAEKIIETYADAMSINKRDLGYITEDLAVRQPNGTRITNNLMYIFDKTPGSLGLSHGLASDKLHSLRQVLRQMALTVEDETKDRDIKRIREMGVFLRQLQKTEPQAALEKSVVYPKLPKDHMLMIAPGSYALHEATNGSSTRVKVLKPVVYDGTSGYLIEKINRGQFYQSQRYTSVEVTRSGIVQQIGHQLPVQPESSKVQKHFVASASIVFDKGQYVGMNIKTGDLLKAFNVAAPGEQKDMEWKPLPMTPELEALTI